MAARRLVSPTGIDREAAAQRFVASASNHGIDLSLMWGSMGTSPSGIRSVRQVCLIVLGAGKTAMCFLSGPEAGREADRRSERGERAAAIDAACRWVAALPGWPVHLAQALPEPGEPWAAQAYMDAGFRRVGELAYLRRGLADRASGAARADPRRPAWPPGVTVRNVEGIDPGQPDRALLMEALDRSYEDTLDCPELCGLRATEDVLASHRATGVWDPALWWLVLKDGQPRGALLLNHSPEQDSVELVYVGLAPDLRGLGLGARLLELGLRAAVETGASQVCCAVDRRNTPAVTMYERSGFREFALRVALVRPLGPAAHP